MAPHVYDHHDFAHDHETLTEYRTRKARTMPRQTRIRTPYLIALAIAGAALMVAMTLALGASFASAHHVAPRAPSFAKATATPEAIRVVLPRQRVDIFRQCSRTPVDQAGGDFFTEYQAYTAKGQGMRQRWTGDRNVWTRKGRKGRVVWDGVSVYNGTRRPVIFAGWCS